MTVRTPAVSAPVRHTSLDSAAGVAWTVRPTTVVPERWSGVASGHSATVPGEVYADLLAAGEIPDPFDGDNEAALAWIGQTDWEYRATFSWSRGSQSRHDLVADGLDTVARISLNGQPVGSTANQHRGYRFDVGHLLLDGDNEIVIAFEGPVTAARRLSTEIGERPRAYPHPYNAIRKMAAGYGWDWGIDAAGVGIWKSIRIESWDRVRIASVRPLALLDSSPRPEPVEGVLECHVELEWADDAGAGDVEVTATIAGASASEVLAPGQSQTTVRVPVPNVERWWPVGYGSQHRYEVEVHAGDQRWAGMVGFRTAELRTEPDAAGTEFTLVVNGQPVYVKGANWIPDDALLTRLTPAGYRASITEAHDAGMNLLRIWGGGIYESDDFYDVCDELGIMVWQDFLFACAAYSESEPLRSEVEAEAREAVTRLSSRPSLVLWNGNNENIWGYVVWGWRPQLKGRSWGDGYYTDLLPGIVAELDPRTPYSPGSPYSFAEYHFPNDPDNGSMHIWDVWNQRDYRHYRDYRARFVSEFGFQGPPAWSTLTSVVHDEPLDPYGPQMLVHQKARDGNLKLAHGLGDHLPMWRDRPTADMDDWHWLTSLNQARAVAYGIEHFRSLYPLNRGSVVWQLNDNWPVISWSAVDYAGIRKPLWFALRRVYADRLLTFQPRPDEQGRPTHALVAHNDSPEPWTGELVITRRDVGTGSEVLAEQRLPFHVEPRAALTVALDADVASPGDPHTEVLVAAVEEDARAFGYFVEDTSLRLSPPAEAYEVSVVATEEGYAVRVDASALVKDLTLFPDRLDAAARVDSALVTLTAGQSHTFLVTGTGLDEVALTARPVLRSVNDLG